MFRKYIIPLIALAGVAFAVFTVLRGDKKMLIEAMLALPHIGDFAIVPKMVDDMLQAHRKWLPQFFQ